MNVPVDPEFRNRLVAKALDSVKAASRARGWFHQFEDGHQLKTPDNDSMTREFLEDAIRDAMGYGYPVEAVAAAAAMTVGEIEAIAGGSAAA